MPTLGEPVDPWTIGSYIFADEGEMLGKAAVVSGLDAALEVAAGRGGRSWPDIRVDGMDRDLERWVFERAGPPAEKWDFVIRDNRKRRWVKLRGAFVTKWGSSGSCTWAINGIELTDDPW
jgi:hypothetical protein